MRDTNVPDPPTQKGVLRQQAWIKEPHRGDFIIFQNVNGDKTVISHCCNPYPPNPDAKVKDQNGIKGEMTRGKLLSGTDVLSCPCGTLLPVSLKNNHPTVAELADAIKEAIAKSRVETTARPHRTSQ